MLSRRDRILFSLFAVQMVTAVGLGGILVANLDDDRTPDRVVLSDDASGADGVADGETVAGGESGPAGSSGSGGSTKADTGGGPAGGGGGAADEDAPEGPIKVGVLVTQTGAINFKPAAQAAKAYFDMVNEQGGVNGHKLEVMLRDDQLDAARGHAAVKEMLNAGVFAFAAWNAPLTELSIVPTLEENQIPLVGNYGQLAEYRTTLAYPFTALYIHYGYVMGQFMADLGVKNPGVIFISNQDAETDNLIKRGFKEGLAAEGVTLSDGNVHAVDVTKATYDDTVAQLRLSNVDGVGSLLDNTAYIRLQQSLNRAAYHPTHVASPLMADADVLNDPGVGESLEGTYTAADLEFIDNGGPAVDEYVSQVRKRFGADAKVNWAGEVGWLGAQLFVEGLRKAGPNPTRQSLMAALDSLSDYETGFTVPFTIRPGGHDINKCLKLGKITAKKVVQVRGWTCSAATWE